MSAHILIRLDPGTRFGRLAIVEEAPRRGRWRYFRCRCDCGRETEILFQSLRKGQQSCGCLVNETWSRIGSSHRGKPRIDLTGRRFGRLVVVELADRRGNVYFWKCRCDCGGEATIRTSSLNNGNTSSCGCLRLDRLRGKCGTHGHSPLGRHTRTYRIWSGMWTRCTNPNRASWKYYGGRGIKVCDRWRSFENFLADMGEIPAPLTIDRIDNDGDYCPENCRIATWSEQNRNKRRRINLC